MLVEQMLDPCWGWHFTIIVRKIMTVLLFFRGLCAYFTHFWFDYCYSLAVASKRQQTASTRCMCAFAAKVHDIYFTKRGLPKTIGIYTINKEHADSRHTHSKRTSYISVFTFLLFELSWSDRKYLKKNSSKYMM